jgi:hypothetical protein
LAFSACRSADASPFVSGDLAIFGGLQRVLQYLGRYTHRAISNHRLVNIEDGQVKFSWRSHRDKNQQKIMILTADEFIRRFLLHVLPSTFHRIT